MRSGAQKIISQLAADLSDWIGSAPNAENDLKRDIVLRARNTWVLKQVTGWQAWLGGTTWAECDAEKRMKILKTKVGSFIQDIFSSFNMFETASNYTLSKEEAEYLLSVRNVSGIESLYDWKKWFADKSSSKARMKKLKKILQSRSARLIKMVDEKYWCAFLQTGIGRELITGQSHAGTKEVASRHRGLLEGVFKSAEFANALESIVPTPAKKRGRKKRASGGAKKRALSSGTKLPTPKADKVASGAGVLPSGTKAPKNVKGSKAVSVAGAASARAQAVKRKASAVAGAKASSAAKASKKPRKGSASISDKSIKHKVAGAKVSSAPGVALLESNVNDNSSISTVPAVRCVTPIREVRQAPVPYTPPGCPSFFARISSDNSPSLSASTSSTACCVTPIREVRQAPVACTPPSSPERLTMPGSASDQHAPLDLEVMGHAKFLEHVLSTSGIFGPRIIGHDRFLAYVFSKAGIFDAQESLPTSPEAGVSSSVGIFAPSAEALLVNAVSPGAPSPDAMLSMIPK